MLRSRLLSPLLVLCLVAPLAAQVPPSPLESLELKDGDSLVFLGDSITHQCLYTQYVEDYLYTRYPQLKLKTHNAGVGGATAWDALQRFDEDVAAFKPKYVTILLGMNDGRYQPYDEATFQTYRQDMGELLRRITEIGATPILMTPTMFDARARRMAAQRQGKRAEGDTVALYNSTLAYYGTWLRDVAMEQGFGFVDMWSPLNQLTLRQRQKDPEFTMIGDAVHPGPSGQLVMAVAIIDDLNFPRLASSIRLDKAPNGTWKTLANGGEVSNLQESEDGLSFTFQSETLPWVVPDEAKTGVELTKLGHRFSREVLHVSGLPNGQYTLTIDGVEVGTLPSSRLIRDVELEQNEKTPQYQQALAVAKLNKERNEGPVKGLRNQWSQFQGYMRLKREAAKNPDNEKITQSLAEAEKKIEGLQQRVAEQIAASEAIEARIYEANQPKPHVYALKRK